MVHIRVTQTWRQRFAEHEPSGAHAADESCRAVNPFHVQETSSIFQLPGHVPDPLGKGGQVQHHLVVEQLSGGCGLEIGATQSLLRASVVRKHHLLMVGVDDSCTPRRTPSLGQLCPEHRHFNSADGVLNPLSQTWPSDVGLQFLDAFVGRCSPSVHRGRTNPGPWLPPLPPFSTPHEHQACLDRGSVKTGPPGGWERRPHLASTSMQIVVVRAPMAYLFRYRDQLPTPGNPPLPIYLLIQIADVGRPASATRRHGDNQA